MFDVCLIDGFGIWCLVWYYLLMGSVAWFELLYLVGLGVVWVLIVDL